MITGKQGKVDGIGYGLVEGSFSFAPNGSSNPVTITGAAARYVTSVTYSATGVQTIQFTSEFVFANAPIFRVDAQIESLTEWFAAQQVGQYNATTRQLVIQQHRAGVGRVVTANDGARVRIFFHAQDSQGK